MIKQMIMILKIISKSRKKNQVLQKKVIPLIAGEIVDLTKT